MAAVLPENCVFACSVDDVPARGKKTVHINGMTILIVACESGLYAVEDKCPQTGRRMSHGKVLNCIITSPNTGAKYDLKTGKYVGSGLSPLQSHWLTLFPVKVVDNKVYIVQHR
jgi:nitrite reductase/ring-hydroxylating ferredoxin subunit